jgi:hypothetical protein
MKHRILVATVAVLALHAVLADDPPPRTPFPAIDRHVVLTDDLAPIRLRGALALRAAARWGQRGMAHHNVLAAHDEAWAEPRYRLTLDYAPLATVRGQLELTSRRFPEATPLGSAREERTGAGELRLLEPRLEQAWLQSTQQALWVRAGLQGLHYRLREDGEAWLLDVLEARSPFDGRPVTSGAGIRATWSDDIIDQPLHGDLFYLRLLRGAFEDDGESVWGGNLDLLVNGPRRGLQQLINVIVSGIHRDSAHVTSAGLGFDWHLSDRWELFAEGYGQAGRIAIHTRDRRSHTGQAARIGARHTWYHLRSEPYVELAGGYRGGSSSEPRFLSLGDIDTFKLIEDDVLGLGARDNAASLRARAGLDLAPAIGEPVALELRYGYFRTARQGRQLPRQLGHELDLEWRWRPAGDRIELGGGAGVLLDGRDRDGELRHAGLLWIELVIRF